MSVSCLSASYALQVLNVLIWGNSLPCVFVSFMSLLYIQFFSYPLRPSLISCIIFVLLFLLYSLLASSCSYLKRPYFKQLTFFNSYNYFFFSQFYLTVSSYPPSCFPSIFYSFSCLFRSLSSPLASTCHFIGALRPFRCIAAAYIIAHCASLSSAFLPSGIHLSLLCCILP